MTLKATIDKLEDVDEGVRGLYRERDGKFTLDVDGMVPRSRLDEFRENNISLKQQIEDLVKKFDGIDPEEARKLAERAQKERDRRLIDAGKVDEVVGERTAAMKADFDARLKAAGDENAKLTGQLEGLLIDSALRESATKVGVRSAAIEDVLLRGRRVFRLVDGKATPMEGERPVYGKGGDLMTIDEWVGGLAAAAPHLFEPSKGGGAQGGTQAPTVSGAIARSDHRSILENLAGIATGKTRVA